MGTLTKIEWCDHTFNPWMGCSKVSSGCKHCYAEKSRAVQAHKVVWGQPRRKTALGTWRAAYRWAKKPWINGHRARVFALSLGDWLDEAVPTPWLVEFLRVIRQTPELDWLLLTKRPENWTERMLHAWNLAHAYSRSDAEWIGGWLAAKNVPENVAMGVSVEDQETACTRIKLLRSMPARLRFVSAEPLLESIDFAAMHWDQVQWIIFGGESNQPDGPARPCNVDWIRNGMLVCLGNGLKVFVKQLGSRPVIGPRNKPLTLKAARGEDPEEWPEDVRVRQIINIPRAESREEMFHVEHTVSA